MSSYALGRLAYLEELEHRYSLTESFPPIAAPRLLERVDGLRPMADLARTWAERRQVMLDDKVDLTTWYHELCNELAG
jgi:hypothetical protein